MIDENGVIWNDMDDEEFDRIWEDLERYGERV